MATFFRRSDREGAIVEAKKIRVLPAKRDDCPSVNVPENPVVVAIDSNGNVLYGVGVQNGKVFVNYSRCALMPSVARVMLLDVYEVAKENNDKTTVRMVEDYLRSIIARKYGVPISLVSLENVKARLENISFSREDAIAVRNFLMTLRKVIVTANKSKKLAEASSYQKGFIDGIRLLENATSISKGKIVIDDVTLYVDDDYNVIEAEVGDKKVKVGKHISEIDLDELRNPKPVELEFEV